MDSRHRAGVDPLDAPQIQRQDASAPAPVRQAWQGQRQSKQISVRWSAYLFASAVVTVLVGLYLAPTDPNAAAPTGVILAVGNTVAYALFLAPLLALTRTRWATGAGLVAGLGGLGLQAECYFGGHAGFFDGGFFASTVALAALAAASIGALVSRPAANSR